MSDLVEELWQPEEFQRFNRTPEEFEWQLFRDIIFLVPLTGDRILLFPNDKDSLKKEGESYGIDDAVTVCVRCSEFMYAQLHTLFCYNSVVTGFLQRIKTTAKYKDLRKLMTEASSLKEEFIDFAEVSDFYFVRDEAMQKGKQLFGLTRTREAVRSRVTELLDLITMRFQSINIDLGLRLNRLVLLFTAAAFIIVITQLATNPALVDYFQEILEGLQSFFQGLLKQASSL